MITGSFYIYINLSTLYSTWCFFHKIYKCSERWIAVIFKTGCLYNFNFFSCKIEITFRECRSVWKMSAVVPNHFYNLPTVNRARSRPSWDLAEAVKLLHDSSTKFLPLRDRRLEATRASNTAAWPLSSIPPGTTFSEPIPSWKKRKWLSGQRGKPSKLSRL